MHFFLFYNSNTNFFCNIQAKYFKSDFKKKTKQNFTSHVMEHVCHALQSSAVQFFYKIERGCYNVSPSQKAHHWATEW